MISILIFLSAAVIIAGVGAWKDIRTGHIPNWLTLGTIALSPLAHAVAAVSVGSTAKTALVWAGLSLMGALVCAFMPMLLFMRDAIGGGDVKLFAAVGALCHATVGLRAEVYSFAFGALYGIALATWNGQLGSVIANMARVVAGPFVTGVSRTLPRATMVPVRFGPAIFAGTLVSAWLEGTFR
jgi:prepilin peptidase CpaA